MSTSVPPQFEQFVRQEVAAGHYQSEDEVVVAALELLQRRKQGFAELQRELQPSIDELDRGGGVVVERSGLRRVLEDIAAESSAVRRSEDVSDS